MTFFIDLVIFVSYYILTSIFILILMLYIIKKELMYSGWYFILELAMFVSGLVFLFQANGHLALIYTYIKVSGIYIILFLLSLMADNYLYNKHHKETK